MTVNHVPEKKLDSLGYILVADSVALSLTILTQLAHKATEVGEIMQNNGYSGYHFSYQ